MAAPALNRVTRACDRCRRNRSRCDPFRPCALCSRAGVDCLSDGVSFHVQSDRSTSVSSSHLGSNSANIRWAEEDSRPSKRRKPISTSDRQTDPPTPINAALTQEASLLSPASDSAQYHSAEDRGDPAIAIARNIYRLESCDLDEERLNAIPGAGAEQDSVRLRSKTRRVLISSFLAHDLPSLDEILALMEEYFESVHWFSLVILEPRFRPCFESVRDGHADSSQKPFLLLLSTMLGIAAWYRSPKVGQNTEYWRQRSKELISNAEHEIPQLLDQNSIVAIQTLTLLGSFYVYHGRPNLSFSLLGATVKAAQAIGLHQEMRNVSEMAAEERRRIWWTIYTWDRFASITYGRPLGINDKDCTAAMPGNPIENISFVTTRPTRDGAAMHICFSAYQRNLNELYLIASPAIESLYSARENPRAAEDYLALLQKVTAMLWKWREKLPDTLALDLDTDCPLDFPMVDRVMRLQSLSLHLTYESLQIILHRPFLKQQLEIMRAQGSAFSTDSAFRSPTTNSSPPVSMRIAPSAAFDMFSHHQWWEAAVRTARTTELTNLSTTATDTHLVSFFALNLFNASIVMVVLALSDPLHDRAQQAKRALTRILRLQTSLGTRSALSKQSGRVIHTLVKLLLHREREAILEPGLPSGSVPFDPISRRGSGLVIQTPAQDHYHGSTLDRASAWQSRGPSDSNNKNGNIGNRLDSSLESVQRVFRADLHSTMNSGVEHPRAETSQAWDESDIAAIPLLGTWETSLEANGWGDMSTGIGDGIGWFWDSTWDEMGLS